MPTISEPAFRAPPMPQPMSVDQHRAAIIADLRDAQVPVTPMSVLARATDVGVPEPVAAAIAATIEPSTHVGVHPC